MKIYTVEDVLAAKPCKDYPEPRVRELWGEREGLTAREIGELPIPAEDRLWALTRVVLGDREGRLLAVRCAREALGRLGNPDPRSLAAVDVAERCANGEVPAEELAAARDAAYHAACNAASAAARDAAMCAARCAARYAAWDSARDAARCAARYAAWDAARDAWDAAWAARGARDAARAAAWTAACYRYLGWAIEVAEGSEQKRGTEK